MQETSNSLETGQNPQSQTGSNGFTPNQASDFQNAGTADTLNKASNQSLQVTNNGQSQNGAVTQANSSPWMGVAIALGLLIVLAVVFVFVYRYAKSLRKQPVKRSQVAKSPFMTQSKPKTTTAKVVSQPANKAVAAPAKAPVKLKKKKTKRKGPAGRRRK